jgi:hypothetical protein
MCFHQQYRTEFELARPNGQVGGKRRNSSLRLTAGKADGRGDRRRVHLARLQSQQQRIERLPRLPPLPTRALPSLLCPSVQFAGRRFMASAVSIGLHSILVRCNDFAHTLQPGWLE